MRTLITMIQVPRQNRLVSCLMVTLPVPDRSEYFKQSLADYCRQTYADRELVVVMDRGTAEGRAAALRILHGAGRDDIRVIDPPEQRTLGALRNISVREARGEILCQWDDDDRHHPERIASQLAAMTMAHRRACFLQDVMQYLTASRELYWTNWLMTAGQALPGTAMCDRELEIRYPERGHATNIGEDSAVLDDLLRRGHVHTLTAHPELYVYVTHGVNHMTPAHHRMLVDRLSLSNGLIRRRETQIRAGLRAFDFGSGEVAVMGSTGRVFNLAP